MSHSKTYLICYDIRDPKRLRRVHRVTRDFATQVQFSVFEAALKQAELDELVSQLRDLIDPEVDCIGFYSLTPECQKIQLGKSAALNGLILV
ncbi:CRISPR-associated endonuclease Cas2 [Methylomarinum sp. Ch1-1]|uniref:CRISPR-associated endoribonuclease Cas2 n=1 Tax=Methylomarinum roseum TaxID=3067653 RepID=A0AAU7NZL5_9GAMM|nr:CRISPR-associated endonuclease Cas2 [Methylomarinum sp. Ch1-1]MDP4521418.1 CRISPR-associated endonuclease Cas2 [Methylomarinum sp. Ch1-1]